jgi:hypothetical protein
MDGADGSTTFTDSSSYAHSITAYGDGQVDTARSKFGTGSLLLDGVDDYLQIGHHSSLELTNSMFTVEMFVYMTANQSGANRIFSKRTDPGASTGFEMCITATGKVLVFYVGVVVVTSDGSIPLNQWVYIAAIRDSSGYFKIVINGVTEAYASSGGGGTGNTGPAFIGVSNDLSAHFAGAIDEVRITKGVARDCSVVPVAAFPNN